MRIKELIYDPQWALPEGSKDQKLPKKSKILIFLVADMQLYKRLCPSVRPLVCWSVGPSVTLYFFWVFEVFGLTAPAQMIE